MTGLTRSERWLLLAALGMIAVGIGAGMAAWEAGR